MYGLKIAGLHRIARLAMQAGSALWLGLLPLAGQAFAEEPRPFRVMLETKLKITVVEWIASEGEYKEWTALGGEFSVGPDGAIDMPLVGPVPALGKATTAIAEDLATRLQRQTGLVKAPSVSVQISAYPPVYVSGTVETPGAVDYRPGLRVIQAVALAGGRERRSEPDNRYTEFDQIRYGGDLKLIDIQIAAQQARRARLEAELKDAPGIVFPAEIDALRGKPAVARIAATEETVFANRRDALKRQLSTLDELGDLLKGEITVLDEKMAAQDRQIEIARKELRDIARLVQEGTVARPRETSLERVVADLESNKLDMIVASMRAKQKVSETTRDAAQLIGQRKTEVSGDLQKVESDLEDLRLKRETTLHLVAAAGAILSRTGDGQILEARELSFAILPAGSAGDARPASGNDVLQPGDLVVVDLGYAPDKKPGEAAAVDWTGALATATEQ